jgi:ketosteroid isomerase-like protein
MSFVCAPAVPEQALGSAAPPSPAATVRAACRAWADRDPEALLGQIDGDVLWLAAAGGPYAGIHRGSDAVAALVARMAGDWSRWDVEVDLVAAADERVVLTGSYRGVAARTRRSLETRFAQVWTVRGGRVVGHEEIVDTARLAAPLTPYRPSIP